MQNKEIKYMLEDIEFWFYDFKKFPVLLSFPKKKNIIGKNFFVSDYQKIEQNLIKNINNLCYKVAEVMNPFYIDLKKTVISIDIIKNSKKNYLEREVKNIPNNKFYRTLNDNLTKHNERLDLIFKTGKGSLKMKKENGIFLSEDKYLQEVERKINQICQKNIKEILNFLENFYSPELLRAFQWVVKDKYILNFLIKKLKTSETKEINLILRQIIPLSKNLSLPEKKKIYKIIEERIFFLPSSSVRNKTLCILNDFISEIKISSPIIDFIKIISHTKQLNCSYPAKTLLKALKIN